MGLVGGAVVWVRGWVFGDLKAGQPEVLGRCWTGSKPGSCQEPKDVVGAIPGRASGTGLVLQPGGCWPGWTLGNQWVLDWAVPGLVGQAS